MWMPQQHIPEMQHKGGGFLAVAAANVAYELYKINSKKLKIRVLLESNDNKVTKLYYMLSI